MLHLLTPIWLTAIAAISIPVIIHLWNIRPGKVLRVGSIALIEASSRKSSRSFSLMDILLLILRCLLLILLAVLLAQPIWSQLVKPGKQKGWILIPRQNIHQVYTQFKPKVDSLYKAGYQLHYFNPGFTAIDTLKYKTQPDSIKGGIVKNWALLKQLSQQTPANLPLYVFTPNGLANINGTKPELALNIHTQTYTPADSTAKWIQTASLITTGDAIKITEGNSKPSGTTFSNTVVQSAEQRNSAYQININNGQPTVSFKGDTTNKAVAVDTSSLRIAIYSDNSTEANYLKAALEAVKQFTNRKISIQVNSAHFAGTPDWVFWLRERPVSLMVAEGVKNVFVYEPGKVIAVNSWINTIGSEKISLTKYVPVANAGQVIWPDGFGNPVLSLDNKTLTNIYHFSTHFDPSWNDLVWSDAFPQMLFNLIIGSEQTTTDKRTIADNQLLPHISDEKTTVAESKLTHQTNLNQAFWLTLILILITERWLAHRNNTANNG